MITIGNEGLCKAKLVIPQGCSVSFSVIHKDDQAQVIDHSTSTANMVLQTLDRKKKILDLSDCVTCLNDKIMVSIPGNKTSIPAPGVYAWDLIVTTDHNVVRMLYGEANIVDTYSLDRDHR
jgi:hypothetical protein